MFSLGVVALALLPLLAKADPVPLTPDTSNEGATCTINWNPDTTGIWKVMNIELMTGPNAPMKHLKTVATLDGTSTTVTSFTYPCPAVEPNSAIYFYQFSTPAKPAALTWTTRWAIADADGKVTPPPQATQPDGQAVPWGDGNLTNPKEANALPAYLVGNGETSQLGGSAAPAPGISSIPSSASIPVSTSASSSSSVPASVSTPPSTSASSTAKTTSSTKTASSSAPAATGSNAASPNTAGSMVVLAAVVALGGYVANW